MGTAVSTRLLAAPKMYPADVDYHLLIAGKTEDTDDLWSVAATGYRETEGVGSVPGLAQQSATGNSIVTALNPDVQHNGTLSTLDWLDAGLYELAIGMRVPRSALLLAMLSGVVVTGVVTWRFVL